MRTLFYGIKVPEDDDPGNTWSDALEGNMESLDDLIGTVDNLSLNDVSKKFTNLYKADWTVDADGKGYKQVVAMPAGVTLDQTDPRFRITSGPLIHTYINPTVVPLSLTSFEVIVNDQSLDIQVLYV